MACRVALSHLPLSDGGKRRWSASDPDLQQPICPHASLAPSVRALANQPCTCHLNTLKVPNEEDYATVESK